jgi:hypothetical protein
MKSDKEEQGFTRVGEGNLGVVVVMFTYDFQTPRGPAVAAFGERQGLISGTERAQGLEG